MALACSLGLLMSEKPISKPYMVAFKATSMETRARVVEWLRHNDAVHVRNLRDAKKAISGDS
jgi:hypothetical protein